VLSSCRRSQNKSDVVLERVVSNIGRRPKSFGDWKEEGKNDKLGTYPKPLDKLRHGEIVDASVTGAGTKMLEEAGEERELSLTCWTEKRVDNAIFLTYIDSVEHILSVVVVEIVLPLVALRGPLIQVDDVDPRRTCARLQVNHHATVIIEPVVAAKAFLRRRLMRNLMLGRFTQCL